MPSSGATAAVVSRFGSYSHIVCRAVVVLWGTGESSWVTVGVWESLQSRFIDFPHVAAHYAACLALHFPDTPITLAFLCGTDHIKKVSWVLSTVMSLWDGCVSLDACLPVCAAMVTTVFWFCWCWFCTACGHWWGCQYAVPSGERRFPDSASGWDRTQET